MILRLLEDEAEFLTKTERKKRKNTHKKYRNSPTFWGEYLQETKKAGSEAINILLDLHYSSQDSQPLILTILSEVISLHYLKDRFKDLFCLSLLCVHLLAMF